MQTLENAARAIPSHPRVQVPNVFDSLVIDFPDAKFLLFETPVDVWMKRIKEKALASQVMGERCGCVGQAAQRSLDSECGDNLHHYCDVYPCLWERTFATWEVGPVEGEG